MDRFKAEVMGTLEEIIKPIKDWYGIFLSELVKAIDSNMPLLKDLISEGVLNLRGKHMRPILTMLLAKVYGRNDIENIISSAVSVELVHVASLVHDDVLDEAKFRHGVPTPNDVLGAHAAVLAGDYILSKGVYYSILKGNTRAVDLLVETMEQLVEGELLQKYYTNNMDIDRDGYFRVISMKTSCLIIAASQLGALNGAKEELLQLGNYIGSAFQIKDDMLDIWGDHTGKAKYNDFLERKITIPLIVAMENDKSLREKVKRLLLSDDNQYMIDELSSIAKSDYVYDVLNQMLSDLEFKAKQIILNFPESEARQSLLKFIDFVVGRDV